jgi:hypothetical protein
MSENQAYYANTLSLGKAQRRAADFARAVEPLLTEAVGQGARTNAQIAHYRTARDVCTRWATAPGTATSTPAPLQVLGRLLRRSCPTDALAG